MISGEFQEESFSWSVFSVVTNLDQFLQGQQEVGLIDSSGVFTISAEKALEKMAENLLPSLAHWILKFVQFAVRRRALGLQVRQNLAKIQVGILLSDPVSLSDFQKGLHSLEILEDRALEHLVTGLRSIAGQAGRKFALRLTGPTAIETLLWDGEKLTTKCQDSESSTFLLEFEVLRSGIGLFKEVVAKVSGDRDFDEGRLLREWAYTVPFPLTLNGEFLNWQEAEKSQWFLQNLLWDFLPDPEGYGLPHFFQDALAASIVGPETDNISKKFQQTPSAKIYWRISYHYILYHRMLNYTPEPIPRNEKSHVFWVRDGVLVNKERLEFSNGFCLSLFVDVSDCPSDLGGLGVRQSAEFEKARAKAYEALQILVNYAMRQIRSSTKLPGWGHNGFKATRIALSHMPLSGALTYQTPGLVASLLVGLPAFRKQLLDSLQSRQIEFSSFHILDN